MLDVKPRPGTYTVKPVHRFVLVTFVFASYLQCEVCGFTPNSQEDMDTHFKLNAA